MYLTDLFDSGVSWGASIDGQRVTFDLTTQSGRKALNVLLRDVPQELTLAFLLDEVTIKHLESQGIVTSEDGVNLTAHPWTQVRPGVLEAHVRPRSRHLQVAFDYPYGRDQLDQLLCDVHGSPRLRPRMLRREHRTTLMFECGEDDGRKPIHYIIACEDVGETSAAFTADEMVRLLAQNGPVAQELLEKAVVRIVPMVPLFCAGRPRGSSYTTLDGHDIYGAATWGDKEPPPEYALLREEVEQAIGQRRLGLLLTIHSWHGLQPTTMIEAIRTAGDHTLSPQRADAAQQIMETLVKDVPKGATTLPERIWHPGLARDYLLRAHNVMTFRIEVTTRDNGIAEFRQTGRQLLENLSRVVSWEPVYPQ